MPKGKIAAQSAHASMKVFFDLMEKNDNSMNLDFASFGVHSDAAKDWVNGAFTKVALWVADDKELLEIADKVKERNLPHALIIDNGLTCFNGEKTLTCMAIGPVDAENLVGITDHLKLLI